MRCNLTEAEQKAALAVPFRCTEEEQEFIERCFIGYLFFEHEADENGRLGVTTECTRCGRKVWRTEREWKRFKQENDVKARSILLCPDCGCGVTLYPRGRLRNGNTLDEYRQVVLLRAIDGALRAVALEVRKHHGRWESDDAESCTKAAYYFAQGKCQKWQRRWAWSEKEQRYTPKLVPQKTMTEPFAECDSWMCRRIGDYAIHGVDQIAASPLRYCAAEQFFKLDGDDPREITQGLLTYLGLWTRYPRIEQLAKAGCEKIIDDAIQGSMNSRALNWRAKTMPAFFGVDKPTVKRLLAGGIGQKELEALELVRHGGMTLEEALTICGRIGDKNERRRCDAALREVGESVLVLARYLEKHQHKNARLWLDYIDAAKRLRYDLTTPARAREERRINPWLSLAQGVILQAIFDWRALEADVKIVGGAKTTFDGLRAFFRSQWADHLLLCTDISALYILDVLENELAEIEAGRTQVLPRVNARPTVVRRAKPKSAAALDDLKQWTNDKSTRRKA